MAADALSFRFNPSVTGHVTVVADARQRVRGGVPPHQQRGGRPPVRVINGMATSLLAEVPAAIEGARSSGELPILGVN
jgi:hypothetical protein